MPNLNQDEFKIMQDSMGEIVDGNRKGIEKLLDLNKVEASLGKTFEAQGIPVDPQRIKQVVQDKSKSKEPTTGVHSKEKESSSTFRNLDGWVLGAFILILPVLGAFFLTSKSTEIGRQRAVQDLLSLRHSAVFTSHKFYSKGFQAVPRGQLEYELAGYGYNKSLGTLMKNLSVIPTKNGASFSLEFSDVTKNDCEIILPFMKKEIEGLVVNGKDVKQFPGSSCQNFNTLVYPSNVDIKNIGEE